FTGLIHENLSIVITFAFSRSVLTEWVGTRFEGEWKYLRKFCFDISEARANRAILEFATQLRILDDKEALSEYLRETKHQSNFGKVIKPDGTEGALYLRDLTNKILHSSGIDWNVTDRDNPMLICHSADPSRWQRAEVS